MILSIESSCDDSSIAITQIATKKVLFHKKISQELEHAYYGGVVPELASRLHIEALPKILEEAKPFFSQLKAVAVTNEPGLSVTLLEGVMMAKGLAIALNIPIIPVHHLKGHIYSLFIEKEAHFPITVLLVSGGHTQIIEMENVEKYHVIASTMDDSFGESFDKVAKMLDLGYPGGPIIESYAKKGDASRFDFPVPLSQSPKIAFSYSGLKNAVRLAVEAHTPLSEQDKYDIAASFQKAAIAHIMQKSKKYFKKSPPKALAIVGGASANLMLRSAYEALAKEYKALLYLAPLEYCSDNAVMIGRYALEAFEAGNIVTDLAVDVNPRSTL
jgi:N6-L-threonylcarbamoyladenine synthase